MMMKETGMNITITGLVGKRKEKRCLEEAVRFFAYTLMHKRMADNLTIDVEVSRKSEFSGQCVNEDGTKRSRWFTIGIRYGDINEMVKTLAHEMVHVKQHAKNELGKTNVIFCKDGLAIETIWNGKPWAAKKDENQHYDSPWEIEAYGREVGLAHRFANHWENICV